MLTNLQLDENARWKQLSWPKTLSALYLSWPKTPSVGAAPKTVSYRRLPRPTQTNKNVPWA